MNRQWVFISFFSQKRNEPKKKVVAAQFSIKECAEAGVVLSENQEATGRRLLMVLQGILYYLKILS
jgi:hypothetical protein